MSSSSSTTQAAAAPRPDYARVVDDALVNTRVMNEDIAPLEPELRALGMKWFSSLDKDGFIFDLEELAKILYGGRKDNAKRAMLKNCKAGIDYVIQGRHYTTNTAVDPGEKLMGRPKENIMLTRKALRMLILATKTHTSGVFLRFIESIWTEADSFSAVDAAAASRRALLDAELAEGIAWEAEQAPLKSLHDQVADRLAASVGGRREVLCDMGRVDVLTDAFAIEVKPLSAALHGLGQALGYAHATKRRPWVHLFEDADASAAVLSDKTLICAMMQKHGVKVTFERF
jgi:hypothetical protein